MTAHGLRGLLRGVALRTRLVSVGRRAEVCLLALAGIYALALVAVRLLGLVPDFLLPATVAAVPLGALLVAVVTTGTPRPAEAARLADSAASTKDLFLSAVLLETAAGEYRPLVAEAADARSREVRASAVVPFRPWRGVSLSAGALLALLAGAVFLPQLDPFGEVERRGESERRLGEVAQNRKATELRVAELRKDAETGRPAEVERALAELRKAFDEMKPGERKLNAERLAIEQDRLGDLWRKLSEDGTSQALRRGASAQAFGADARRRAEWRKELAEGKTDALRRELKEMRELAREAQSAADPDARARAARELSERLESLREFASSDAASPELKDALARAMQALSAMQGRTGQASELSEEAARALAESLDLTEQELESLAQAMRNLERLEDALSACRACKSCNGRNGLEGLGKAGAGDGGSQYRSLEDYRKLYEELMSGQCSGGEGPGMGGPGRGRGNVAPEDDKLVTDTKSEKSDSHVGAGRMLLEWKTQGMSDAGEARKAYREAVAGVRQSLSEAIAAEEVPPGYHETIRGYFDSLAPGPAAEGGQPGAGGGG